MRPDLADGVNERVFSVSSAAEDPLTRAANLTDGPACQEHVERLRRPRVTNGLHRSSRCPEPEGNDV